jgi:hypothetical protein
LSAILAYGVSIIEVLCALLIGEPQQEWLPSLFACCFGLTWGSARTGHHPKAADLFPGRQLARSPA